MNRFRQLLTTRQPSLAIRAARWGLRALSLPYWLVTAGRNAAYQANRFKVHTAAAPVISIGNLSVGGTGKSPLVAWIARWFRQRNVRVAILSRGYGQLDSGQNDEALELELSLPDVPHLQHWDRVASAQLATEELDMQVLLLDDGFQHRRLARELDIVLIDATDPPSARHLLPGGLLREPLTSLRRAQLAILTRSNQAEPRELVALKSELYRIAPKVPVLEACHRPSGLWLQGEEHRSLSWLKGRRVLAFCGIGNPHSFLNTLLDLDVELVGSRIYPDHYPYAADDVIELTEWVQQHANVDAVVCTLKDWVKLQTRRVGAVELMALTIELEFVNGRAVLEQALAEIAERAKLSEQQANSQ